MSSFLSYVSGFFVSNPRNLYLAQHCKPKLSRSVIQLVSRVRLSATSRTEAWQASLSFIFQSLLKFMSIESVMLSTISFSATLFSFCLQSFPASESFQRSQLFASGGQTTEASASASVLWMNVQGLFPLGLTGLISLLSKGHLKSLLQHYSSKASIP